jgi:hypothetical protein
MKASELAEILMQNPTYEVVINEYDGGGETIMKIKSVEVMKKGHKNKYSGFGADTTIILLKTNEIFN